MTELQRAQEERVSLRIVEVERLYRAQHSRWLSERPSVALRELDRVEAAILKQYRDAPAKRHP